MTCTTKTSIGGCSIATIILSLVVTILGVVIMTSGIPAVRCGNNGSGLSYYSSPSITPSEKDDIDNALIWIGAPALVGGILGIIGAAFGIWGGCAANKCGMCSTAVLLGIGGGIIICAALFAMAWASVFGHLCDDYDCGTCRSLWRNDPSVCCDTKAYHYDEAICKETKDWACDMATKKILAMIASVAGSIVSVVASSCACAASCCCPDSFEETKETQHVGGQVVGQVVGQPVGNEVGGKS